MDVGRLYGPVSERHPYVAEEAHSRGCACVTVRSLACPYHAIIDHLAVLVQKFGADVDAPSRSLLRFPNGFGNTLTKSEVVSSYPETLRKAGVLRTSVVAKELGRSLFKASWFNCCARCSSMAVAWCGQGSPLLHQHEFIARVTDPSCVRNIAPVWRWRTPAAF